MTNTIISSTTNEAITSSSSSKLTTTEKAADILSNYLKSTTEQQLSQQQQQQQSLLFERVSCCNSSRSLYCSECCTVLIPSQYWPESIQNNRLDLPFDVHVILDKKERRTSSTGLQLTALFRSMRKNNHNNNNENYTNKQHQQQNRRDTTTTAAATTTTIIDNDSGDSTGKVDNEENVLDSTNNGSTTKAALDDEKSKQKENKELLLCDDDKRKRNLSTVELYDLERVEIPMYNNDPKYNNNNGVYVLFPDKDSIPISQVVAATNRRIQTLIVLDMKWSSQTVKLHPNLMNLPKVHLTNPPSQSHFWRWHTSGKGMLSTIEAIYFASMEVLESSSTSTTTAIATTQTTSRSSTTATTYNNNNNDRQQQQQNNENDINCSTIDTTTTTTTFSSVDASNNTNTNNIIDMMWLFALQYSVVHDRSQQEQRILPFTEEGKNRNRELRQKQHGNPTKKKQLNDESFY